MKALEPDLAQRRRRHGYRRHRLLESPQGPEVVVQGRRLLNFSSNDYLGLAADPRLAEAACRALRQWGTGAGSAHLVCGHSRPHRALEAALAEFTGYPRALLFSSGYLANLAVPQALLGRGDTLIQDRLDHASLIDGARLSGARLVRYRHNDLEGARQRLERASGEILLAVDGVFSMDGDLAPLPQLAGLCREHGAWLLVDDAHGLGVLGGQGRGSLEHWGLGPEAVPVLVGTFGKALGTSGAFVAGSEALVETLIQQARSYLYTTAAPPALAATTLKALELVQEEPWRRERLAALVARFRAGAARLGLPLASSATPIQPLLAGSAERALAWSRHLEARGILAVPIRPPTVPEGSARLRLTLTAAHRPEQVDRLLEALAELPP